MKTKEDKTINKLANSALAVLVLAWFALSPTARAVSPAPDGGYANGNTAEGTNALFSLTTGIDNTANGFDALYHNTTGHDNTATGFEALFSNTSGTTIGNHNTATGSQALFSNTTGDSNTANGHQALYHNTTGSYNTANGRQALYYNITGSDNTATGYQALRFNTGSDNAADGESALYHNTTGAQNTAIGGASLYSNTTGGNNTATGEQALWANTTGSNNTVIGVYAGRNLTSGSNNIDISNPGVAGESGTTRIGQNQGRVFIQGIGGTAVTGPAVVVSSSGSGQLGVAPSSRRFKDEIKRMGDASDALLALKPVTFHYKKEIDPEAIPQFGLVAEEVEQVNPDLVVRDKEGKPYSVRYEQVNAMLLNEFLKEHRKVEQQEATITQVKSTAAKQQATIANQQKQIEALTTGLQKVSAQVEMSRPAPQTVDNHQ